MIVTHKIKADLCRRGITEKLNMVQGDLNTRQVEITMTAAGEAWTPPEGAALQIYYKRADGVKGSHTPELDGSNYAISGNIVKALLPEAALSIAGSAGVQVMLEHAGSSISLWKVEITVQEDLSA